MFLFVVAACTTRSSWRFTAPPVVCLQRAQHALPGGSLPRLLFVCSVHNTLFLEVHCPAVRPQLVVISDNGRPTLDFEQISIGQSVIKSLTIQNISDSPVDVRTFMPYFCCALFTYVIIVIIFFVFIVTVIY